MEINGLECGGISQTTNNKRPSIPEFCRRNNGSDYDTSKLIETTYDHSPDADDDDVDVDDDYGDDNESNNSEEMFYSKEIDSSKETYDEEEEDDEGFEVKMPIKLTPKMRRLIEGLDAEALRLNELLISSDGTPFMVTKNRSFSAVNNAFKPRIYEKKFYRSQSIPPMSRCLRRISEEENQKVTEAVFACQVVRMDKIPENALSRKLDPRERRRLKLYNTLPEDAIVEYAKVTTLPLLVYKYGCCLDTSLELNGRTTLVMDYKRRLIRSAFNSFRQSGQTCVDKGAMHDSENSSNSDEEEHFYSLSHDECRHFSDIKIPNLIPPNPMLRILLVFSKTDPVYDALVSACQRLNVEPSLARSSEAALELFQNVPNGGHHVIVVDSRNSKYSDAETLGRSIRNSKGNQHAIMVAVVKKSVFEKDDTAVVSLLDAGYNRCMIESPHISICCSELRQIQHSLVRPQNVISTQQALYTALHRSKDGIIITDDTLRTQFANKSVERLLNMKIDEIIGRPLSDLIPIDGNNIISQTSRHREYDGNISIRRKSQEFTSMHFKVIPVSCVGRSPTHLVITMDTGNPGGSDNLPTIPQAKEAPRGSLHSIRRGSFDVRSIASDGLRRTSLAKLSSLPLEAPITKVLTILAQVQEGCSYEEAKLIDRVMEFLKREGLYSPQMKEIRTDDPVANDLIGALLTQGPTSVISSRRSSNDSIIRGRQSSITTITHKIKPMSEVTDLLQSALSWDFEIFKLEELTEKRPLLHLGMELFRHFDVFETFNCDEATFRCWLIVIENHYRSTNTYHNSTHAADVMQATAAYLQQLANRDIRMMDSMDEATALIAAATHDIDHPGRSSAFLCNSDDSLALLYNDNCVLESHHAATTFKLTLSDEKINIFKNLEKDRYKSARAVIVDMILATEMTKHFEHLAKFVSVFGADSEPIETLVEQESDENQMLVRRMLIKCADVSNPTRPLKFCVEWARRIAEEYFSQTDDEKRLNLPIVMPMFDRAKCSISKSQIGFIEYIIQDMMNAWDGFIDMPEIIQYMEYNYNQWKIFEEQGIKTLNDIKRKQMSITSQPQFSPLLLQ